MVLENICHIISTFNRFKQAFVTIAFTIKACKLNQTIDSSLFSLIATIHFTSFRVVKNIDATFITSISLCLRINSEKTNFDVPIRNFGSVAID